MVWLGVYRMRIQYVATSIHMALHIKNIENVATLGVFIWDDWVGQNICQVYIAVINQGSGQVYEFIGLNGQAQTE
jgi:hypothetical protein